MPTLIFIAIALSFIPVMTMYGPEAALIAEASRRGCATAAPRSAISSPRSSPAARRRSSRRGCSPTYHSSLPIALYILLCAIIGIVATALLTDYTNKDISAEYEAV